MMGGAANKVDFETVQKMVKQLSEDDQLRLLEHLRTTWRKEFRAAIAELQELARKYPVSDDEILRECEAVREEHYRRELGEGRR